MVRSTAIWILLWLCIGVTASAHEIRPAYLQLVETNEDQFEVAWKQPITDGRRLVVDPVLPSGCMSATEPEIGLLEGAVVSRWSVRCDMQSGHLTIAGLDRTLTDVFVKISYIDGSNRTAVLKPSAPTLDLSVAEASAAPAYVRLGFEHILSGPDHLLFVAGLLVLVRLRKLFIVVTAFTLAHSLTLALTMLGWVELSPAPVETLIAISIVLIAIEAVNAMDGRESFASRWPWLISFCFGLLHGFGFAGALGEIGLPENAELAALFFFNVGVEIGQLAFICGLLVLVWLLGRLAITKLETIKRTTAYTVGIAGVFWTFERLGTLIAF
ncbi:MAG: HupE/UreJ family protein [Hyphomonadaceae bacterium]